jgi:hypothetical protein
MATKSIRDCANEHALLRLQENEVYASQGVPIGNRSRRAPWPPSPNTIPLVLLELNAGEAEKVEDSQRH